MVKPAMSIISDSYVDAADWTLGQLMYADRPVDKTGLAYAYNKGCVVMPKEKLEKTFYKAGYGKKGIRHWFDNMIDLKVISVYVATKDKQYVAMLESPLSKSDLLLIEAELNNIKRNEQETLDKIKREAAAKEEASS